MFDLVFQGAQSKRIDKQTGAPATANGTTNLVSLPGATDLLSVAAASGALTQTTSGNNTTVAVNLGQILAYVTHNATFDYSLEGIPVLKNIDATVSFGSNPGNGTSVPVTSDSGGATGTSGSTTVGTTNYSITGATARYQLFNKFDPHSSQFKTAFQKYASDHMKDIQQSKEAIAQTSNKLVSDFQAEAADTAILEAERAKFLAAGDTQSLIDTFNTYFISIRAKVLGTASFKGDLAAFGSAMNTDLGLYRQIVIAASGVPALTAEYTFSNSPNQPVTHNIRVIGGFQNDRGMMLTFNGAATFYGGLPQGAQTGHFRDFQFAGQGDFPIAPQATNNTIDLTVAGYGQYQQAASILNVSANDLPSGFPPNSAPFVAGTQGWLGVGQVKVTIRGPNGVQIVPLSWKWSNRTDLFTQSDSGFQFGLSYDVSSFSQLFGSH
jgi:hypothetical protein